MNVPPGQSPSVAIANTAVALHRESFGRGPGAAKSYLTDGFIACVLSDVFTASERILIDAGEAALVRATRTAQQVALQDKYRSRMAATVGRPIATHLSTVHIEADIAVDLFMFGG